MRAFLLAQTCSVRRNMLRVRCKYIVMPCFRLTEQIEGCFAAAAAMYNVDARAADIYNVDARAADI